MGKVKSLEDLLKLRDEALTMRDAKMAQNHARVTIGMGTCGIAAGAGDTLKAILDMIRQENLSGISVTQTGCIGLCEQEPIVQVVFGNAPKVTYGKVNPERARLIMKEHVIKGNIIQDLAIPS
jgi:NADP-reducing hydrogenase subunit HndB